MPRPGSTLEFWIADYHRFVPAALRDRIEMWLSNAGGLLGNAAWNIAAQTFGAVTGSIAFVIGLATAPVLIFYLLKDSEAIRDSLYTPFPARLRPYLRDLMDIVNRSVGGYIRGQLLLGLLVGGVVTIGLLIIGIPFPFILGIVAGLTELIPIIGPWIGGAVGVLVTLAVGPGQGVVGPSCFILVVQLLENALLVPRVQANTLGLASHCGHPGHHHRQPVFRLVGGNPRPRRWPRWSKGILTYAAQEWNRLPGDGPAGMGLMGQRPPSRGWGWGGGSRGKRRGIGDRCRYCPAATTAPFSRRRYAEPRLLCRPPG